MDMFDTPPTSPVTEPTPMPTNMAPRQPIPSLEEIEEFLSTRSSTLWGEFFNIQSTSGRTRAARWFRKNMMELFDQ